MRKILIVFMLGLLAVNNSFGQTDSVKYLQGLGSDKESSWNNYVLMIVSLCLFAGAFYVKKKFIKKAQAK